MAIKSELKSVLDIFDGALVFFITQPPSKPITQITKLITINPKQQKLNHIWYHLLLFNNSSIGSVSGGI